MAKTTIRQCMDAAFQLMNQYSIAGALVPLSYNDQADAENRMVNLINDAQMEIATAAKPIAASLEVDVPEPEPGAPLGQIRVEMPEDFNHFLGIYYTPANGRNLMTIDANKYKWLNNDVLLLPDRPAGKYLIEYNRFPEHYPSDIDKSTELDNSPDTHAAIPYYVAAMLLIDENPKAYYALYNTWETRLARLTMKPAHAVSTQIEDVYGFNQFRGVW